MADPSRLRYRHAVLTDKGNVRKNNEDFFLVDEDLSLFILADGMGGHAAGEVASRLACEAVLDSIGRSARQGRFLSEAARAALDHANRNVYQASENDRNLMGMGTTLLFAWANGSKLRIGHVGDSRLYRFYRGRVECLTRDHEDLETGWLTSAIGVFGELEQADVLERGVVPGEVFLLCTDGLFSDRRVQRLEDEDIAEILASEEDDLEAASRFLIERVNELAGDDNTTVLLFAPQFDEE